MSSTLFVAAGVFGLVLSFGYLLSTVFDRYTVQLRARLRDMPKGSAIATRGHQVSGARDLVRSFSEHLVPDRERDRRRHQSRLLKAGIYSPSALSSFFAVKLALMVIPPCIGMLAAWSGIVSIKIGLACGALLGGVGMILPSFWLDRRIHHRHSALRRALPDFLDLMIVCLEGGLSLQGTIQRVGDELRIAHPTLASELGIVQREVDLGVNVDTSLRRFADRCGFDGIRTLSTFVREAQRIGTELAEALRLHAEMLRSQRESAAEETTQKASVKILMPTLLLILPAVFVVLAGPAAIQIQQAFSK